MVILSDDHHEIAHRLTHRFKFGLVKDYYHDVCNLKLFQMIIFQITNQRIKIVMLYMKGIMSKFTSCSRLTNNL